MNGLTNIFGRIANWLDRGRVMGGTPLSSHPAASPPSHPDSAGPSRRGGEGEMSSQEKPSPKLRRSNQVHSGEWEASKSPLQEELTAFDRLPIEIKRALWMAPTKWSGKHCLELLDQRVDQGYSRASAVRDIVISIRNNSIKELCRFSESSTGTASPHVRAKATMQTYDAAEGRPRRRRRG